MWRARGSRKSRSRCKTSCRVVLLLGVPPPAQVRSGSLTRFARWREHANMGGGNAQKWAMARQRPAAAAKGRAVAAAGMEARGGDTAAKIAESQAAKTAKLAKQAEEQAAKAAKKRRRKKLAKAAEQAEKDARGGPPRAEEGQSQQGGQGCGGRRRDRRGDRRAAEARRTKRPRRRTRQPSARRCGGGSIDRARRRG